MPATRSCAFSRIRSIQRRAFLKTHALLDAIAVGVGAHLFDGAAEVACANFEVNLTAKYEGRTSVDRSRLGLLRRLPVRRILRVLINLYKSEEGERTHESDGLVGDEDLTRSALWLYDVVDLDVAFTLTYDGAHLDWSAMRKRSGPGLRTLAEVGRADLSIVKRRD